MTEPCDLTAVEARRLIGVKALSPVELMDSCLGRIDKTNPRLNAIVDMDRDAALAAARAAEAAIVAGAELGALHGLPVAIKDNRAVRGLKNTSGSLLLADNVAAADEPGVAALRAAGAIPFAKTNMPEFGAGGNTVNRVFGVTKNPFDESRTAGGSSGGSAVALATGMAPLATGSDYGGSLRTPAAFCGVVGFRPSLGVAPSREMAAVLSPWGVEGPMGRTLADAHLLLSAQATHDADDPFSHEGQAVGPLAAADLATLRVAVSADLGAAPVAKTVRTAFQERAAAIGGLAGERVEAHPDAGPIHDVFEITRGVTFLAAHADRVKAHRDSLDRNVVDNVERAMAFSAADVAWAQREQAAYYRRVNAFFREVDVLVTPGASVPPFPHDELFVTAIEGETMPTYMRWLAISYIPTLAFCCAALVPAGTDARGLPFGLTIVGPKGADAKVLSVALALEAALAEAGFGRAVPTA